MKFNFIKVVCLVLCFALTVCAVPFKANVYAAEPTLSELQDKYEATQKHLNDLKNQRADQQDIINGLNEVIRAKQEIIDQFNKKINAYSEQINSKQKEIDKLNNDIETDKETFKKRIRSLYMSNSKTDVQIVLGANSFSEYLVLSQVAKTSSKRDKALIDKIVDAVTAIDKEKADIQKLLDEQKNERSVYDKEKAELDKKVAEVNRLINSIDRDIAKDQADLDKISDDINKKTASGEVGGDLGSGGKFFLWPSARFTYVSAGFDSDDSVHRGNHKGIDIAGGGIMGTPIRAAAAGKVYLVSSGCPHNYGKNYSCSVGGVRCGGGYGNYVAIDHDKYNGKHYKTLYAHMKSVAVRNGQHVQRGQVIGYVGTTGWSTGPHIHFETIVNGKKVNPKNFSYDY